jgi:hypothetical protein
LASRFVIRWTHARSSSSSRAFASDSIGWRCSTGSNLESGRPPTRWVGESGVSKSGCSASIARSSPISASYSSSPISGSSRT